MFARTKRLMLRPGWLEDAAALAKAIAHESVVTKLGRAPWPYTVEHAIEFLSRPTPAGEVRLLITELGAGEPRIIGCIGIHDDRDGPEFGYWLTPDAWGRGYATEAGKAVVEAARHALPMRRLAAGYFVENPASGRVLRKLGFRETGRREPRFCLARGHDVEAVRVELDLADQGVAEPVRAAA